MPYKNYNPYCPAKDKNVTIIVNLIDYSTFEDSSPKYIAGTRKCLDCDSKCTKEKCILQNSKKCIF